MFVSPNQNWGSPSSMLQPNPVSTPKRKRPSCGAEWLAASSSLAHDSSSVLAFYHDPQAQDDHPSNANPNPSSFKKARTANFGGSAADAGYFVNHQTSSSTDPSPHTSSPVNVPFSSDFRAAAVAARMGPVTTPQRPPTVEEQQAWSSGSSNRLESPSTPTSIAKGKQVGEASGSNWVRVVTSYGHTFVRHDEADEMLSRGDVDMILGSETPSPAAQPPHPCRFSHPPVSTNDQIYSHVLPDPLWNHIEGDVEMNPSPPEHTTRARQDSQKFPQVLLQVSATGQYHPYHMMTEGPGVTI
ncbi:hypothetical protein IE53DRAFT_391073 [Violaceomyces palustris]|uniref:Uncharacterized protein n=1 Tax=Violaceomyces palustris TaxID=1673888 RepID=A0ACD0NLW0_9BASI|nr:hypothetical protein IE53DRAFT_391073 [Violaceomyces palustris]